MFLLKLNYNVIAWLLHPSNVLYYSRFICSESFKIVANKHVNHILPQFKPPLLTIKGIKNFKEYKIGKHDDFKKRRIEKTTGRDLRNDLLYLGNVWNVAHVDVNTTS